MAAVRDSAWLGGAVWRGEDRGYRPFPRLGAENLSDSEKEKMATKLHSLERVELSGAQVYKKTKKELIFPQQDIFQLLILP